MEEENKKQTTEKKDNIVDNKKSEKVEIKKKKIIEAVVNSQNKKMSTKDAAQICNMIRGRSIDRAIEMIKEVLEFKRVVKMNSLEKAHRHGKGVMAGRYPINACKIFLKSLNELKANALFHELELEKCVIFCKADKASQPYKSGGRRFKRTHLLLKLIKKIKINK